MSQNDDLADFMAGEAFGYRGSAYGMMGAQLYDQRQETFQQGMNAPHPRYAAPARPAQPWFPGVDAWFDRHLSMRARRRIALFCAALFALVALGYATDAGLTSESTWLVVGGAAFGGLILLPLLVFAIKLTLFCLILGALAGVGWILYTALQ